MEIGNMFGYIIVAFLWILTVNQTNARHVPLASQRNSAQSRPRLLVIRPPEGSGQPKRIVVLANQRPQPTNPSPPLSTAISALQETAAVAQANLNRAFGGHPQSAFRQQSSSSSSSSSGSSSSSASSGTRSLRNILQGMRRSGPSTSSNIAHMSETIPRAMPPVLPPTKRFGELNIPSVIEAALRRLQERARLQGNVRNNNVLPRHNFRMTPTTRRPHQHHDRSPFSGGVIDLSRLSLNERSNRNDGTSSGNSGSSGANSNPRWDIGTILSTSTLGRNGVSPLSSSWNNSPSDMSANGIGQNLNGNGPFLKNNDLLQMPTDTRSLPSSSVGRTGSNLRTFQDKTFDKAAGRNRGTSSKPTLDIQTLLSDPWTSQNSFMPAQNSNNVATGGVGSTFEPSGRNNGTNNSQPSPPQYQGQGQSPKANFDVPIPAPSRIADFQSPSGSVTTKPATPNAPDKVPKMPSVPAAAVSLNASAKVSTSSAEANSTSNQTSTKSVKTKTIKVTTVVKGGTKAGVSAAAASQANIANAVAQGKQISGPALEKIAKSAAGVTRTNTASSKKPAAGSITVRRQPNGNSIITLSDGQGEPVVLSASGPVKIERIVKPNGRIQFLINPVQSTQTTINPAADGEIEPEDITTTVLTPTQASLAVFGFTDATWTTNAPFYTDSVLSKSSPTAPETGPTKIEKTIQITDTAVADTASASVNTSVKNATADVNVKSKGLMQLFKTPNIPRPPKVSDMNLGNAGIVNPLLANNQKFMINPQTKNVPPPSDVSPVSNKYISSTVRPTLQTNNGIQPLDFFPSTANQKHQQTQKHSDVMPQYNLLGVSPLTFAP
ncbi:serine-rich adhesin for platelets-like [Mercenaria mercenaria]|uniref:serine-rich adhesin for platelets-like n=1 Tax=Mercenaria mercenaria TaxID=6596 RepID=UPI00234F9893|nr:serine-rich adhesin for platelets-like [Mercenaria mercenaria]